MHIVFERYARVGDEMIFGGREFLARMALRLGKREAECMQEQKYKTVTICRVSSSDKNLGSLGTLMMFDKKW
jgi:hypothetical protein